MIHVRRHKRVTARGKTVTVRAHERDGDPDLVEVPVWSKPVYVGDLPPAPAADVAGIWDDEEAAVSEHPEGTWYVRDHGELYAVWPDGTTHLVPEDEPAGYDEGIQMPGSPPYQNRAQDV
jgi:hypothetical protein